MGTRATKEGAIKGQTNSRGVLQGRSGFPKGYATCSEFSMLFVYLLLLFVFIGF